MMLYLYIAILIYKDSDINRIIMFEVKGGILIALIYFAPFFMPSHYPVAQNIIIYGAPDLKFGFMNMFHSDILRIYLFLGSSLRLYIPIGSFKLLFLTFMSHIVFTLFLISLYIFIKIRGGISWRITVSAHILTAILILTLTILYMSLLYTYILKYSYDIPGVIFRVIELLIIPLSNIIGNTIFSYQIYIESLSR